LSFLRLGYSAGKENRTATLFLSPVSRRDLLYKGAKYERMWPYSLPYPKFYYLNRSRGVSSFWNSPAPV
jgi:hypothetical protein